jgi:hypothetical protein
MRTEATMLCALVAAGSLLLVACPSSSERAQLDAGLKDASPPPPVGCLDASDTTGPCPVAIGCDGGWTTYSSIPAPTWIASARNACVEHPSHSPPQLYDDCPVVMRTGCDRPERNAMYCDGNRLIATCRVSDDCPAGWVCADQSRCEKGVYRRDSHRVRPLRSQVSPDVAILFNQCAVGPGAMRV